MKEKIKKGIIIFLIIFAVVFIIRFIFLLGSESDSNYDYTMGISSYSKGKVEYRIQNIASSKIQMNAPKGSQRSYTVEQKYEKIAEIKARTHDFENDLKNVKTIIKEQEAIIQLENNSGIKGNRALYLAIGVHPDKFEIFVDKIKKIGKIKQIRISKTDKTSEFKELNAKKESLEKVQASLKKLKNRAGKIEELIKLEDRILEIEEKLQALGLQLGDFDEENEFCTVELTLTEGSNLLKAAFSKLFLAFTWTLKASLLFLVCILFAGLATLIILIVVEKLKKAYIKLISDKERA